MTVKDEATTSTVAEAAKFRVNVKLVLVRVVVQDSSGHAVGNLHKEDFELFDNGKLQVISDFDVEHHFLAPSDGSNIAGSIAAPPPIEKSAFPERYVAYLFDDLHLNFEDVNRVRQAAEHRVDALNQKDRIGIFFTSGQSAVDFTDDRIKLQQALENLRPRPTQGGEIAGKCPDISLYMADMIVNKNDPEVLQAAVNDYEHCANERRVQKASSYVSVLSRQILQIGEQDSRQALSVMKDVARRIAAMPGQRTLILVSPGFITPELQSDYNELIDRALRAQVIISSIDARGLYVLIPFGDASKRGQPDIDVTGQLFTPDSRAIIDLRAASAQSEIMALLANSTGGTFFHNNNDMEDGLRRVADPPEFSYMLAFTPQNLSPDGKFHTLKVRLKVRGKYHLDARNGYYAPRHAADAAEEAKREIEDELFSREQLHDLPVAAHTQFFKASDETARLTVLANVDVKRLHYRHTDDRDQNDLTLITAVFDRNGNFLQANQKIVTMKWKTDTLQGKLESGITLRTSFNIKPGRYLVRVVARDTEQQLMSAENVPVEIP